MTTSHWFLTLTLGCYSAEIKTCCILYFLWPWPLVYQQEKKKKLVWVTIINSFIINY